MEIINFLNDALQHLYVSNRRNRLRQPGQGYNYSAKIKSGRKMVNSLHPKRMQLCLLEIILETPSTKTFRFERTDAPLPPFRPGQYITLFLDVDGVLTSRPYSIASAPGGPSFDITVRDRPDGFVAPFLLREIEVGAELESTGPAGHFYYEPLIDGDDLVFLAGGSGITPFMSLIRDTIHQRRPLHIHLIYGSRTPVEQRAVAAATPRLQRRLVGRKAIGGRAMRTYQVTHLGHDVRSSGQAGSFTLVLRRFICSSTKRS